ncbi:hypothetical protein MRB53_041214 [Persea americana]|nr:hypothetical protein MRB53_041214 [Persea americana]
MAPRTQGTTKNTPKKTITRHHSSEIATPSTAIDYGAVQKDEIEALQAIFMDDFEEIQVEGAWNKTSDHRFKLRIASFNDLESFVILTVRLTATYPKTVPLIEVDGLDKFHERTQQRISVILHSRPKQLLGEVMIHAIATEIQDALEDAVQARQQGTLPSLIEERASAEEVASALAKQAEDAEAVRQKELHEEEEKALTRLVEQEVNRREKRKTGRSTDQLSEQPSSTTSETIVFEEAAEIIVGQEIATFQTVLIVSKDGNNMIAKPQLATPHASDLLKIRRCTVKSDRTSIIELETTLKQVRNLRHTSITTLYSFRFDKHGDQYVFSFHSFRLTC